MTRFGLLVAVGVLTIVGCGTPEVARDYESRDYLPQELEEALRSDDLARRADAAGQVEAMEPGRRRQILLALTEDDRAHVRLMAVSLLARHHAGDAETVARMAEVLSLDPDIDVRSAAIGALAASGDVSALKSLVGALTDDPSLEVKRQAATTLDRLTGEGFGAEFAAEFDEAETAADDTMMAYDDWLAGRAADLGWDAKEKRFVSFKERP
jgi:HEAT repeat protein